MMREEDLARMTSAESADCPSADDLASLATGDLSEPDRLRLVDHLAACDRCAAEYRAVQALEPWAVKAHATLSEAGAISRRTPDRLGLAAALALAASVAAVGVTAWSLGMRSQLAGLREQMASMRPAEDLAAVEASARAARERAARLEQELADSRTPDLNAPIVDLVPGGSRGAPQEITVDLPERTRYLTLILTLDRSDASRRPLDLEIAASDGRVVGRWPGLRAGPFATATAIVPATLVPPGVYRVRLLAAASTQPIQEYDLRVRRAPEGR